MNPVRTSPVLLEHGVSSHSLLVWQFMCAEEAVLLSDDQVIPELRQIAGPHFPLYLFGGFRDGAIQWKDWIDQRMELNSALYGFLVMDVHVCKCDSPSGDAEVHWLSHVLCADYLWNDKYKTMGMDGVLTDVANTYDYMGRLHKVS